MTSRETAVFPEGYAMSELPWRSRVTGIIWPGVSDASGDLLASLLWQLEQSQWLSADAIAARQFTQLAELIPYARQAVPFYRKHLRGLDLKHCLRPEHWRSVPILTRKMVQQSEKELMTTRLPLNHGRVTSGQTSGSTGQPITVANTDITGMFWHALTLRGHLWHKRDLRAKLASIRIFPSNNAAPPNGAVSPVWGLSVAMLFDGGPCASLNISATIGEQIAWLKRQDPVYLLTYPTNLAALVERMSDEGIRLPRLREVWTISETLTPVVRAMVADRWGVPVVDMYSSQEFGYIAIQCPVSGEYHVQSETVLLEVLNDQGEPCAPGEIGRVVATGLHNYAFPLIRYEIGDYAEVGSPCVCGRGLPTLRRIVGRTRNMLRLPGGERRWPVAGFREFMQIAPVRQFQLVQKSLQRVEARLVVARPLVQEEEARVIRHIQDALRHPFEVGLVYLDTIARSKSGKFEEFVCQMPDDLPGESNA